MLNSCPSSPVNSFCITGVPSSPPSKIERFQRKFNGIFPNGNKNNHCDLNIADVLLSVRFRIEFTRNPISRGRQRCQQYLGYSGYYMKPLFWNQPRVCQNQMQLKTSFVRARNMVSDASIHLWVYQPLNFHRKSDLNLWYRQERKRRQKRVSF